MQLGPDVVEHQGGQQQIGDDPRLPVLLAQQVVDEVGDRQEAPRAGAAGQRAEEVDVVLGRHRLAPGDARAQRFGDQLLQPLADLQGMIEESESRFDPDLFGTRLEARARLIAAIEPLLGLGILRAPQIFDCLRLVEGRDVEAIALWHVAQVVLVELVGIDRHEIRQGPQLASPVGQEGGTPSDSIDNPRSHAADTDEQTGYYRALTATVVIIHAELLSWCQRHYAVLISKYSVPRSLR